EQAHPAHRGDDRVREGVALVVVPDDRGHLFAGEGLHGLAQILVFRGQAGIEHVGHPLSVSVHCGGGRGGGGTGAALEGLDGAGGGGTAEDVGHPAGDGDQLAQVDAGGDAESVQHPHEVFGGEVAGGGFGVGAAAEASGG